MKKQKKNSFKENLIRLEEISELLESNDLEIEKAIELYEEGVQLSKLCMNTLNETELKVKELKNKFVDETSNDTDDDIDNDE